MKKEEFFFDSRDGETSIHGVRWMPDDTGADLRGIIQVIHGMEEYVERYEDFARFMTERGFIVTGEDHLGHGGTVGEGGTKGYFCEQDPATVIVRDVHRLKKITRKSIRDCRSLSWVTAWVLLLPGIIFSVMARVSAWQS